jgi:hypothetical protein
MDLTVKKVVRRVWSVDPAARGSFEGILEALRRIRFKLTPAVDVGKVMEFVALVEPSTAVKPAKRFPPSVKKGIRLALPDGIIAHLTRECGGNVNNRHVVDVTSGSFEKETLGANPHSIKSSPLFCVVCHARTE